MQVKAFKLTTGEEIIAYAEPDNKPIIVGGPTMKTSTEWVLSKVRGIQLTPTPQGGLSFVLLPWIASNPDMEFTLPASMIAFEITPLKGIEDTYVAQTSVVKPASSMPPPGISGGIKR